jgi:hypothetical protein
MANFFFQQSNLPLVIDYDSMSEEGGNIGDYNGATTQPTLYFQESATSVPVMSAFNKLTSLEYCMSPTTITIPSFEEESPSSNSDSDLSFSSSSSPFEEYSKYTEDQEDVDNYAFEEAYQCDDAAIISFERWVTSQHERLNVDTAAAARPFDGTPSFHPLTRANLAAQSSLTPPNPRKRKVVFSDEPVLLDEEDGDDYFDDSSDTGSDGSDDSSIETVSAGDPEEDCCFIVLPCQIDQPMYAPLEEEVVTEDDVVLEMNETGLAIPDAIHLCLEPEWI